MDIGEFQAAINKSIATNPSRSTVLLNADELRIAIRECFPYSDTRSAIEELHKIVDDLGIRKLCNSAECDPYYEIASVIRDSLAASQATSALVADWGRAIELGVAYSTLNLAPLSSDQRWISNSRVSSMSTAIIGLRNLGYKVDLTDKGGISISEEESLKIKDDIHRIATSLGETVAYSATTGFEKTYSPFTGRFHVGRRGSTIEVNSQPIVPIAYLYQLGLRYINIKESTQSPQVSLKHLVDLVTWATTLLDLTVGSFELMSARPHAIPDITKKSMEYDAVFLVAQAKPTHAGTYLEWLLSQNAFAHLKDRNGRTIDLILAASMCLIRHCIRAQPDRFLYLHSEEVAFSTNLDFDAANQLLRDVFTHQNGANQKLSFPPSDNAIDAAFRPLVVIDGRYAMQPAPLAARAVMNAAIDWCRKTWRGPKLSFDAALGVLFEEFVRVQLRQHGVTVLHGKYPMGTDFTDCDAVVVTPKEVIFFELKGKLLTRDGRSGDDILGFKDLAQAVVRPQTQAMERHAELKRKGSVVISNGSSSETIEIGAREVLRVSVTRGELGSVHDRPYLQLLLRAGCLAPFRTKDPVRQGELKDLNGHFDKLRDAALRAEVDIRGAFPFNASWSLSIFQLMLILEQTTGNETLSHELQRNRYAATPTRDFYVEYHFLRDLEIKSARPSGQTSSS